MRKNTIYFVDFKKTTKIQKKIFKKKVQKYKKETVAFKKAAGPKKNRKIENSRTTPDIYNL